MIAYVKGTLAEKSPYRVIVDVGGVGYEVFIPLSTFDRLPAAGEGVKIFTCTACDSVISAITPDDITCSTCLDFIMICTAF